MEIIQCHNRGKGIFSRMKSALESGNEESYQQCLDLLRSFQEIDECSLHDLEHLKTESKHEEYVPSIELAEIATEVWMVLRKQQWTPTPHDCTAIADILTILTGCDRDDELYRKLPTAMVRSMIESRLHK